MQFIALPGVDDAQLSFADGRPVAFSQSLVETGVESSVSDFSWGRTVEARAEAKRREATARMARFYQTSVRGSSVNVF